MVPRDGFLLYHYYDESTGPLRNLSALRPEEGDALLNRLKEGNFGYASRREGWYMERRRELEALARSLFLEKGGRPRTAYPHYFVIGECPWLETWYPRPRHVCLPLAELPQDCVSFTYGDMFPTFSDRVADGREYRKALYTADEILRLIEKYGLPQEWNPRGEKGPERYVEAQVWLEDPISGRETAGTSYPGPGFSSG